jgi:hypothetical protein
MTGLSSWQTITSGAGIPHKTTKRNSGAGTPHQPTNVME